MKAVENLTEDEFRELMLAQTTEGRKARFEEVMKFRTRHITVALENLLQPHNASAIIRNCDCFGIQDLHIIENDKTFAPAEEIARGAQKWVTQKRYNEKDNNTLACIQALRADGYRIVAASPHEPSTALKDLDISKPTALFFGSEWPGLSEIVMDEADEYVRIPMYGFTESFNVSVSVAMTLYDVSTRLFNSNIDWQLTEKQKNELRLQWAVQSAASGQDLYRIWLNAQK